MKYLVLNPTWTVPPGILEKDILPAARQDPAAVAAKGLNVFDSDGNPMDPVAVNWSAYTGRNLPYTLRQDAGPRNALGKVKFIFPNEHAVFLHDTPSRTLFDRTTRTFSSGCVRVENPLELAELLLDDPEQWSMDEIQKAVDAGEPRTVFLPEQIPVLLLYWTASVGFDGDVHFWPDVYDRDPECGGRIGTRCGALVKPDTPTRPDVQLSSGGEVACPIKQVRALSTGARFV
jgi:murein L,D-transpeptidase YcbB/YkuD